MSGQADASETFVNPPVVGGASIAAARNITSTEQRLQWQ